MAAPQNGVWGIDIGQCGVKAIRLENIFDELTATAFDYIEYPKILTQPDADPDQLIREALEQFLSRNSIQGDTVVIAVPGQSGLARFVKLPPVEERKIADIVKFEAKQQIPFPLEEVVWDFQKLGSGEVTDGFAMGTEIGLFALKRDMVFRYLQHFKDVGVEVQIVQMAPLALCNFVAYDLIAQDRKKDEGSDEEDEDAGKKKCVVALDIGTDNSNLVITDGDCIIWQRPIPLGGNHFTRALTKDMKLTFAKAEHLKRNAVKSPDLRKILSSLKTVLNDFVGEVQRSLGYFTNTHRDAKVQYMIGLGNAFRLPGLQKYLQEKLQLEVRKFNKLARVEGEEVTSAPTFTENLPSFAVAYGLALQGMNKTRLTTNLLPYEVHMERLVRSKKPWAVAAAACMLLIVAGYTFAKAVERNNVSTPDTDRAVADMKDVLKKKKDLDDQYIAAEKQLAKTKLDLQNLAGGVEQRWNWQLLHEYINLALPQPNGTRLFDRSKTNTSPKSQYYNAQAKDAFRLLENKRLTDNKDLDPGLVKENEIKIKKHLVQINVEAISARFADNLLPYYLYLMTKEQGREFYGMSNEDLGKLREVKPGGQTDLPKIGWLVEIRGYTYHEGRIEFVKTTFVENLNRFKELADMEENRPILDKPFQPDKRDAAGKVIQAGSFKYKTFKGQPEADKITKVEGKPVKDEAAVQEIIDTFPAGKEVKCAVSRNDKEVEVKFRVEVLDKTLRQMMAERIEMKKSLLFLYNIKDVPNPVPGVFTHIGVSNLETLVKGDAAVGQAGGKGDPKGDPKGASAGAGPGLKDRSAWKPVGAGAGAAGQGVVPPAGGVAADEKDKIYRTEFVILFVWEEPYLGFRPAPAATATTGAVPPPPPPPVGEKK